MASEPIALTRAELYERIWETPTRKLAIEFGISDVAIVTSRRRLCHTKLVRQGR